MTVRYPLSSHEGASIMQTLAGLTDSPFYFPVLIVIGITLITTLIIIRKKQQK
jgi:hypothetical protein